jgi:hypothetical protein
VLLLIDEKYRYSEWALKIEFEYEIWAAGPLICRNYAHIFSQTLHAQISM